MKYRIQKITYRNGQSEYISQVKGLLFWRTLNGLGEIDSNALPVSTREHALARIDRHFAYDLTVSTIEFEFVNKP
jgi:hypothetical protein